MPKSNMPKNSMPNNSAPKKRGRPKKTDAPSNAPSKIVSPETGLTETDVKDVVKKKHARPDLANYGCEYVKPGDNARMLRYARVSMNLPPIDISDVKQVEQRINEYFDFCEQNDRKPQVVGMANWLGVSRMAINQWKRGEIQDKTKTRLIENYINLLEELWIDYMQNGKANPASLIFIGKNMFGYKDVQDVVVTPNQPLGAEADEETLRKSIEGNIILDADYED